VARSKRGSFKNTGTQFDPPASGGSLQEWDEQIFGEEDAPGPPTANDDLLAQLPNVGLKRTLKAAGGVIQRRDWVMSLNGLEFTGEELTYDDWKEMGDWLTRLRDSIQWMIGDWANLGAANIENWVDPSQRDMLTAGDEHNEIPEGKYRWLADLVDYSYGTLRNFAYIAYVFPVSRRRDTLTYSHHVEVAVLGSTSKQEKLLDKAEKGKDGKRLSVRDLRDLVQQEQGLLVTGGDDRTNPSPIYRSLVRLQQELTPERWQQMSADERQQIHSDLRATLAHIEELGLD
jgi:hypothetical protein